MRVLQGILLSLFIHFFLMWSAQFAPVLMPKKDAQPIVVEITERPPQSETTTSKQIVRETLVPDDLKTHDSQDPLSFLSAETQRVKKQTQAAISGMTKNRSGESSPAQEPEPRRQEQRQSMKNPKNNLDPRLPGGLEAFTPKYRKAPALPVKPTDPGLSTIGEALPNDVAIGSFTALNTDRLTYYSFFARIEEMIRFRWESGVRSMIDSTPPERLTGNTSGLWTTQMEIWLKRNGEVHSIHVMKEAGFKGFDQAAIQAFKQARIFPNPPQEMVESDGLIHLRYSFQVRYEPKVLVKSSD